MDWTGHVAELARVCGCTVRSVDPSAGTLEIDCPNLQAKVDLLDGMGELSALDPYVQALALELRRSWNTDALYAASVHRWVSATIKWREEPGERFVLAAQTLRTLIGDCDCQAIVIRALLTAVGIGAEIRGYANAAGDGLHAACWAEINGQWYGCETTTPKARFGDDPRSLQEEVLR